MNTITITFPNWVSQFSDMPLVLLFLICIFWGNKMLRREHFKNMNTLSALLFNAPSGIMFLTSIGIALKLIFVGLQ